MSSLLNVGARALLANQIALQTTGNNIANASTAGYSRQSVVMSQVPGQYTGLTRTHKTVNFPGRPEMVGQMLPVTATEAHSWGFMGQPAASS